MTTNDRVTDDVSGEVLVYGATGNQGGAVIRALMARGRRVVALARDAASPKLDALRARGVRVVEGDIHDATSIARAARGVDAIFAMTTPFEKGPEAEIAQGRVLVDAARRADVRHIVFSSVAGADRATKIAHFESKRAVETMLGEADLPFTIVAPVYFMENSAFPASVESLRRGVLARALPASRPLQQIALSDLGRFVAYVLEHRDAFLRVRLDVASDELDGEAEARHLSRALGRPIRYEALANQALRAVDEEMASMFDWFDRVGYAADLPALRRLVPDLTTFEQWLRMDGAAALR